LYTCEHCSFYEANSVLISFNKTLGKGKNSSSFIVRNSSFQASQQKTTL
jgi:hypothetical protein